jgi:hypothetical protein
VTNLDFSAKEKSLQKSADGRTQKKRNTNSGKAQNKIEIRMFKTPIVVVGYV